MPSALLIRLSSLGDVVHTFPAVTDLARHCAGWELDWVVEEGYRALAALHPAVTRALPFGLRRWRRHVLQPRSWRELAAFKAALRAREYDRIVDAQGLLKSLAVAKMARGRIHGFGPDTVRESFVARFYDHRYEFPPEQHRVSHYRGLLAAAFGYSVDMSAASIDYGLRVPSRPAAAGAERYSVLLHSTARAEKLWPEARWIELGRLLHGQGIACALPWGSDAERARAERLAAAIPAARLMPALGLEEAAGLIAHAHSVIGVDTGLMHLAVAYKVPVVGVYLATRPGHHGPLGAGPTAFVGGMGASPVSAEVFDAAMRIASNSGSGV